MMALLVKYFATVMAEHDGIMVDFFFATVVAAHDGIIGQSVMASFANFFATVVAEHDGIISRIIHHGGGRA